ncbi:MAG: hypothetical protein HOQ05_04595 [Corynebacteriales bacterium]|nr:hypothetical protein [Mycobacteriales bacterium]
MKDLNLVLVFPSPIFRIELFISLFDIAERISRIFRIPIRAKQKTTLAYVVPLLNPVMPEAPEVFCGGFTHDLHSALSDARNPVKKLRGVAKKNFRVFATSALFFS